VGDAGLTAPLSRLAQAAAGFSLDRDAAPLPERGEAKQRAEREQREHQPDRV